MTIEKTPVGLREKLVNSRLLIVIELIIVVALIAADLFGLIRVPLTLTLPLLLIGWLSLRLRGLRWRDVGLRAPSNWKKTIVLALIIATIHQLISTFVLIPFLQQVTGQTIDLSLVDQLEGNLAMLGLSLIIAWLLAGFGEEFVYRGYLLNRFADVFGQHPMRWILGCLLTALLFGWAHEYQGIVGIVDTFVGALVLGGLYLYSGRNLWLSILTHGFYDTIAFVFAFFNII